MGCHGDREKLEDARAEQKWSYINLGDFRSTSCYSPLSYGILYIFLLISVAVYAVDLFTAANLLFFDRWSGQVKPVISFKIARWIFAACILLSLVLLVYRWIRALRMIKSGVVAASYLDPLAVRIQSVRPGARGQGWRRFLVFAALTEGRKGAEYVALFTYFSFEGILPIASTARPPLTICLAWMRIVFAEGPRQLLNAQTLYSVMQANLVPAGEHAAKDGHSPISQFWINLRILADHNREQAAILFGMLFTLIIWVFSVVSLLLACIFYITFLWHHIPARDGSLKHYCRRKIDTRLSKIVGKKIEKAIAREERLRAVEAAKGSNGDQLSQIKRQPTIPVVDGDEDSFTPTAYSRQTTQTTFSSHLSQHHNKSPNLHREATIPNIEATSDRPEGPSRSTTQSSVRSYDSYGSDAPLINAAGRMGYGPPGPARSFSRPLPSRSASGQSSAYDRPPISRKPTPGLQSTQQSYNTTYTSRPPPGRMTSNGPRGGPSRQNTENSSYGRSMQFSSNISNPPIRYGAQTPTPTDPPAQAFELRPQPPRSASAAPTQQYVAYNPNIYDPPQQRPATTVPTRSFTPPSLPPLPVDGYFGLQLLPQRSDTAPPLPPLPIARSGTAPPMPLAKDFYHDVRAQDLPTSSVPPRAATAGPGINGPGWNRRRS
ncbi:MAG: hypothetical protein LQ352_001993 [Teloschistes flavicans]|nr:MAG: hypothetical protein LQ352_001993 [Teloschistes flavicans]